MKSEIRLQKVQANAEALSLGPATRFMKVETEPHMTCFVLSLPFQVGSVRVLVLFSRSAIRPRGETAEVGVRAVMRVVAAPCRSLKAGMAQGWEHMLIEACVARAAIDARGQAALHRFARLDGVPLDAAVFLPVQHRIRR